jgi:hypothetical protein
MTWLFCFCQMKRVIGSFKEFGAGASLRRRARVRVRARSVTWYTEKAKVLFARRRSRVLR